MIAIRCKSWYSWSTVNPMLVRGNANKLALRKHPELVIALQDGLLSRSVFLAKPPAHCEM